MKFLGIGINYVGTSSELRGCINDVYTIESTYKKLYGLKKENTRILLEKEATKEKILDAIHWLVSDSKNGEQLFFHYSGHGGQIKDMNKDEYDGKDETIIPIDYETEGYVTDDELKSNLVDKLRQSYLVACLDCCHSGTVLDLNYIMDDGFVRRISNNDEYPKLNCCMISGCMDNQTSADAYIDNKFSGALTHCYNTVLKSKPGISYIDMMTELSALMKKNNFPQKPVMSFNREPNIHDNCIRSNL